MELKICVFCEIEKDYIVNGELKCPECYGAYSDPAYYSDFDTLADYYS